MPVRHHPPHCQHQHHRCQPAAKLNPEPTQSLPTPTPLPELPEVQMTVNGAPYAFSHPLQIMDGTLWLPAVELFQFINRKEVSVTNDFVSTGGDNLQGVSLRIVISGSAGPERIRTQPTLKERPGLRVILLLLPKMERLLSLREDDRRLRRRLYPV